MFCMLTAFIFYSFEINCMIKNIFYLFFFLLCLQSCTPSTNTDSNTKEKVKPSQSCQNCGMDWAKYPKSAAFLQTQEDKVINFCSNRCLFTVVLNSKPPLKIKNAKVVDYFTQQKIAAQTAFYVIGSDQMGSMGHDFIAHKSKDAAQDFQSEHQGKRILSFQEVDLDLVQKVSAGKIK